MTLQTHVMTFLTGRWGRILGLFLLALFLLLILVNLANILIETIRGVTVETPPSEPFKPVTPSPIDNIAQWHLLGEAPKPEIDASKLPASLINATLIGVFSATPESDAMAAIKLSDDKEKVFKVGETLAEDVKIYKILPDRVILKRGEHLEVLVLPDEKLEFEPAPQPLDFKAYQD